MQEMDDFLCPVVLEMFVCMHFELDKQIALELLQSFAH